MDSTLKDSTCLSLVIFSFKYNTWLINFFIHLPLSVQLVVSELDSGYVDYDESFSRRLDPNSSRFDDFLFRREHSSEISSEYAHQMDLQYLQILIFLKMSLNYY